MGSDIHETFEQMIDETLAGNAEPAKEEALRRHLQGCARCQEYLAASTRVIEGLRGFSFDVDAASQAKVCAVMRERAQQMEAAPASGRRMAWTSIAALILTVGGSFVDLQFGGLIASTFDIQRAQMQQGVIAFGIVPSLCLLILIPILLKLSAGGTSRQERIR
jgi:anti-sigma factor RsiW